MDLFFFQYGVAVAYITYILLYSNEFTGPIVKRNKFVYNSETFKSRPVNFFDYVRRILHNPYIISGDGELWVEDENKLEVWSCYVCLSFWVSFLVSIPYIFMNGISFNSFFIAATLHFSCATVSLIINRLLEKDELDGLQLQKETDNSTKL